MRIRSILNSSIGNLLEWYDFGLYALFSPVLSRLFFPNTDAHTALLMTFSVLAIGFMCRPLGALLFGYLGDSQGRTKALRLSILMISLPTLLIGCLPTYASVGIAAPLLLIFIRMWQGVSLGGEYSGTLIYLTETAPKKQRAMITSFAPMSANLGILLAALMSTAMSYLFNDAQFQWIGWRIPYIFSGVISLYVYYKRLNLQETVVFNDLKAKHTLVKNPPLYALKHNIPEMLRILGMVCMGSTFYYLCFIYMPTFLTQKLHYSLTKSSSLMTCYIALMLVLVPLAGMLCDRISRRKILLFNALMIGCITIPGFYFLSAQYEIGMLLILFLFTIASSLEQAATCVAVVENYPPPARYSGLSLSYNISNAIFGGTAPLVCELLIGKTNSLLSPAFYIVLCALITGCVIYFTVPDTRHYDLL